jgi:hypothetical protein
MRRAHRSTLALLLLVLTALAAPRARAASGRCPPIAGGAPVLEQVDPALRLHWIDAHLARTAHRARLWTWGWGTGLVVATVANLAPLAFVSPDQRIDWYVGAGTTLIGIVPLLIAPLDVVGDSAALRAKVTAADPAGDLCPLLADAERTLARDAQNQADGRRWWMHAANVALNVGVGLFLGLGYHHWLAGGFNAVSGIAIGEAIIFTQPTSSIDDLASYRGGALGGAPAAGLGVARPVGVVLGTSF